jgi:hypothetical protein
MADQVPCEVSPYVRYSRRRMGRQPGRLGGPTPRDRCRRQAAQQALRPKQALMRVQRSRTRTGRWASDYPGHPLTLLQHVSLQRTTAPRQQGQQLSTRMCVFSANADTSIGVGCCCGGTVAGLPGLYCASTWHLARAVTGCMRVRMQHWVRFTRATQRRPIGANWLVA